MEVQQGVADNDELAQWHRAIWMQTYTGKKFYPTEPSAEDIDVLDIAHSLSMQCRYNGHVKDFYSVAEHCVLVSTALQRDYPDRPELWLEGLLHDSTEAYVGDMVRPLKIQMPAFVEAEDVVMAVIAERFGVPQQMSPEVKDADTRILLDEKAVLFGKQAGTWAVDGLEPLRVYLKKWGPDWARFHYVQRFNQLTGEDVEIY